MARTIKQIKKAMTDQFMKDENIRSMYGLNESDTFDGSFSAVSLESILFGIVASAVYVLEVFFDSFRKDVDARIEKAVLASIPWYHKICLEYQHGDGLVLDEATQQYVYEVEDDQKRIVKYAACRDNGGGVYILVAGDDGSGVPTALSDSVLTAFRQYINARKPAGVVVDVYSYDPDDIQISITVQYDPLVLNADGSLISDPSVYPVEDAVNGYLADIIYGGRFNRTRLTDAVQAAEGVADVVLGAVSTKRASADEYMENDGQNITSVGGSFKASDLRDTIRYELQF